MLKIITNPNIIQIHSNWLEFDFNLNSTRSAYNHSGSNQKLVRIFQVTFFSTRLGWSKPEFAHPDSCNKNRLLYRNYENWWKQITKETWYSLPVHPSTIAASNFKTLQHDIAYLCIPPQLHPVTLKLYICKPEVSNKQIVVALQS